jgi:Flp pilus assembly protein TadG
VKPSRWSRRGEGAQAAFEMALVLPIMFMITIGFIGVMLELRAQTEFRTAVDLAAQASIVPPLGDTADSVADYQYAFEHTLDPNSGEGSYLTVTKPIACSGPYLQGELPVNVQGVLQPVTCTAAAALNFSDSPIGMLWFWSVDISATSQVQPPVYRSCEGVTPATASPCQPSSEPSA